MNAYEGYIIQKDGSLVGPNGDIIIIFRSNIDTYKYEGYTIAEEGYLIGPNQDLIDPNGYPCGDPFKEEDQGYIYENDEFDLQLTDYSFSDPPLFEIKKEYNCFTNIPTFDLFEIIKNITNFFQIKN